MISQDNFVALLDSLGFAKNKSIYSKTIGATSLSVDVTKQTIQYPESDGLVVNERQTSNFSANENFVVFECVHHLALRRLARHLQARFHHQGDLREPG